MRGTAIVLVALFVVVVPLSSANTYSSPYTTNGTYKVGLAAAQSAGIDACLDAQWQGQTGDCVYMRSDAVGKDFELQATGNSAILGLTACFFTSQKAPLGCQGNDPQQDAKSADWAGQVQSHKINTYAAYFGRVPAGSAFMSVSSYSGTAVNWMFDSR